MQQNKFNISALRITGILLLVVLLACVRLFEETLFYDPFLEFFKHKGRALPDFEGARLLGGLAFRYFLNSIISLGILWLAFKDTQVIKLCAILLAVFFVVLAGLLLFTLSSDNPGLLLVFYVRRFLIQPLFVILFLPAFYYQKHLK